MDKTNDFYKKRWVILILVLLMTFMSAMDSSIISVSMPDMAHELKVTMAQITLVMTIYIVVISALVIIFGRIGDLKGKTLVFRIGIIVFTAASLLCGISSSLTVLLIARAIQAVGAACAMATNQAIITDVFPSSERGRALGMNGTGVALGMLLGPPIGGLITQYFSWHYVFIINVPIGIILFLFCIKFLPHIPPERTREFDFKGATLFFVSIMLLFSLLSFNNGIDIKNITTDVLYLFSLALIVLFIYVERHQKHPLLALSLFKNSLFSISIFCSFLSFVGMNSRTIILPFYFQDVLKLSAGTTGLLMMFSPLMLAFLGPLSGHLSDKIGSEILTVVGLVVNVLGYMLLATVSEHTSLVLCIVYICISSIGSSIFQSPNTSLIMSTAPLNKLSIVGSINALVRNLGQILGLIISSAILYYVMSVKIGHTVTDYVPGRNDIFVAGMHWVFIFASVACFVGLVLTGYRMVKYKNKKSSQSCS